MMEKILIGWQKQPNKLNIQGTIEKAIEEITKEKIELNASGRTDAGVHSFGQVANFKTESNLPAEKFLLAINAKIKKSIVIKKVEEVDEKFHSRYNCKKKTYRYVINNSSIPSAIYRYLEYYEPKKLDVEKMQKAAKYFEGQHDFKAFKSSGTSSKSSVRTIYKASIIQKENNRIYIELTGNGFLYNMVRIISGTLVDVGLRKNKTRRNKKYHREKRQTNGWKNITSTGPIFNEGGILIEKILNVGVDVLGDPNKLMSEYNTAE